MNNKELRKLIRESLSLENNNDSNKVFVTDNVSVEYFTKSGSEFSEDDYVNPDSNARIEWVIDMNYQDWGISDFNIKIKKMNLNLNIWVESEDSFVKKEVLIIDNYNVVSEKFKTYSLNFKYLKGEEKITPETVYVNEIYEDIEIGFDFP